MWGVGEDLPRPEATTLVTHTLYAISTENLFQFQMAVLEVSISIGLGKMVLTPKYRGILTYE